MYKIKRVKDLNQAKKVWGMFLIPNIIGVLSEGEKLQFRKNIENTIHKPNSSFFYVEEVDEVIGAIGVWENYLENGGYVIEHFAVREDKRGKGIGGMLFKKAEDFISSKKARYILIETGDNSFYEKARQMYKNHGFRKVSHFPTYYDESCGREDYMKILQ